MIIGRSSYFSFEGSGGRNNKSGITPKRYTWRFGCLELIIYSARCAATVLPNQNGGARDLHTFITYTPFILMFNDFPTGKGERVSRFVTTNASFLAGLCIMKLVSSTQRGVMYTFIPFTFVITYLSAIKRALHCNFNNT